MQRLPILLCISLIGWAQLAYARPVSYPDGWTAMQMNDGHSNSLHMHYSPSASYSVGYKGEYFRDEKWQFHGVQLNNLLKRWNQPDSQANFYLKSGLGLAHSDKGDFDNKTTTAAYSGIATDWEDRRFFVSYENRGIYAGDIDKFFTQKTRIGIAPYIGDYGDIHTWLMLQADHSPANEDELTITPLVRLFKGPTLLEAGISNRGTVLFNFIHRF